MAPGGRFRTPVPEAQSGDRLLGPWRSGHRRAGWAAASARLRWPGTVGHVCCARCPVGGQQAGIGVGPAGVSGGAGRDPGSSWRVVPVLPRSLQEGHLPMGTAGVSWLWLQQTLPGARSSQPHCHLQGWLMGAAHPAPGGRPGVGPREPGPCSGTALGRLPGTRDKMEAGLGRGRRDKAALCGLGPERRPGPCSAASEGPVSPAGTGAPPRGGSREGPLLPAGPLPACPPGALSLGFLSVCWGDATFAHTRGRPGLHTLAGAMGTEPFPRGLCRPGQCGAPGLAAPAGPPVAVPAGPAEGGRKIPGPVALGVGGGEGQGLRPAW